MAKAEMVLDIKIGTIEIIEAKLTPKEARSKNVVEQIAKTHPLNRERAIIARMEADNKRMRKTLIRIRDTAQNLSVLPYPLEHYINHTLKQCKGE